MNTRKHPPLTEQQIKLIRQDLKDYMSGKIKLTEIAIKRKIPYHSVVGIQNQAMTELLSKKI